MFEVRECRSLASFVYVLLNNMTFYAQAPAEPPENLIDVLRRLLLMVLNSKEDVPSRAGRGTSFGSLFGKNCVGSSEAGFRLKSKEDNSSKGKQLACNKITSHKIKTSKKQPITVQQQQRAQQSYAVYN